MTDVPKTARELEEFIANNAHAWPLALQIKANSALNARKIMDRPDNQGGERQRLNQFQVDEFAAAYAEWRG